MGVNSQPIAAAESSSRAHSAAVDERPAAMEAAEDGPPPSKEAAEDGPPPSKEAGDGTAEGRPPLSKETVEGEELAAKGPQAREGEGLREPEVDGEDELEKSGICSDELKKPTGGEPGTSGQDHKNPVADKAGTSGDGPKKPSGDDLGTGGDEPKKSCADEAGTSGGEPKTPTASSMPVRAWVAGLGTIGDRMLGLSTSISGYQANLAHVSEFLQRVASYAPDSATAGPGPAVLTSIAGACGNVGAFLGNAAAAIQGATSIAQLLGATLRHAARLYGPEVVPEPEPKAETASSPTKTKIIVSTVEQAVKVINWIRQDSEAEVDVHLDVTPFMAIKIYEEFRSQGAPVLSRISGGAVMKLKRAAFYDKKES